jgi:hypothetical protein
MEKLKRIRYHTMNSWNMSTAPAYNMKVYNVIDRHLRDKVYQLMDCDGFYDSINNLIREFDAKHKYLWQAGFNGRSGGYLVLYKGGRKISEHKSYCTACGQRNFTLATKANNTCGRCNEKARVNKDFFDVFSYPGKSIDDAEVPTEVLKDFEKLAENIITEVVWMAENSTIEEEEYTVTKTRKIIV